MTKFEKQCREVAEKLEIEVDFYPDDRKADTFEDDGTLHVLRRKLRACFDVSNCQNDTHKRQNEKTRDVLRLLNIPVTDGVLVDEHDDEESEFGRCSMCGRSCNC